MESRNPLVGLRQGIAEVQEYAQEEICVMLRPT